MADKIDEQFIDVKGSAIRVPKYSGGGTESIGELTLSIMHSRVHSVGMINHTSTPIVTKNGAFTIDVATDACLIRPTNNKINNLEYLAWNPVTNFDLSSLTGSTEIYVYIDYTNGASIQISNTNPNSSFEDQTVVLLAEVHAESDVIQKIHDLRQFVGNHPQEWGIFHREVFGVLLTGQESSEIGTRNLAITAGVFHKHDFNNIDAVAFDSSAADTFDYYYRDGVGGFTKSSSKTQLNNTQYDNDSGALQTLAVNKWKKDWIYRDQNGAVAVIYSQAEYNSEQEASDAVDPSIPTILQEAEHSYKLATYRVEENTAPGIMRDEANRFQAAGTGSAASDHGNLIGLADNDHPNYHKIVGYNGETDVIGNPGGLALPVTTKINTDSPYTALISDHMIRCNATSGAIVINLPTAANSYDNTNELGLVLIIKKIDSSVNTVTIDGNASETIDGSLSKALNSQYESLTIQSNGTSWDII